MKVKWIVYGKPGALNEDTLHVLDLDEPTEAMYRGYHERISKLDPGPKRSALINELRVQMDMIALLDARVVPAVAPTAARSRVTPSDLPDFDGETYVRALDHERLGAQLFRVGHAVADGGWHTLASLNAQTGDPEASISARLRDLRKRKFGGHTVERERLGGGGLFRYRVVLVSRATIPWGDDEDDE